MPILKKCATPYEIYKYSPRLICRGVQNLLLGVKILHNFIYFGAYKNFCIYNAICDIHPFYLLFCTFCAV